MAVKRVKVNRRWVWQARVAYEGERRSTIRETKPEAKIAEGQILTELKERAGRAAEETAKPATLRSLFELYAQDLVARGKGNDTLVRAVQTAHVVERLMPELLDRAVDRIGDADIFAFRKLRGETSLPALEIFARATAARDAGRPAEAERLERQALAKQRDGTKPATINRDMRTLRAMLRKARPGYRFQSARSLPRMRPACAG